MSQVPDPVTVVPYDPDWPACFEALRDRIAAVLGSLALRIEHVGSTSVPGLAAKPIIDLDVIVRSPADVPGAVAALSTLGYVHQGDKGIPGRESFRWPPAEARHHLYVCIEGSPGVRDHLMFRDYLRTHPEAAAEYAALKLASAQRHGSDRDAYGRAKAEFIERLTRLAAG